MLKDEVSEERTLLMEFSNSHFMYMFINDFCIKSRNWQRKFSRAYLGGISTIKTLKWHRGKKYENWNNRNENNKTGETQ